MLYIKLMDDANPAFVTARPNGVLDIAGTPAAGVITLTSTGEFAIHHITIGVGKLAFAVKIEMNMNPDPDTAAVWALISEDTMTTGDLEVFVKSFDLMRSFKNQVKITVTNAGTAKDFNYFISVADRAEMTTRKY